MLQELRNQKSCLQQASLIDNDVPLIIPTATTMELMHEHDFTTHNIYECSNIKELMLFHHTVSSRHLSQHGTAPSQSGTSKGVQH